MSNFGLRELPAQYNFFHFPFMRPAGPSMPITEPYVMIPSALVIRTPRSDGKFDVWTLGFDYDELEWRGGKWEYDILLNGHKTGEFGRIIEFRKNKLKIW